MSVKIQDNDNLFVIYVLKTLFCSSFSPCTQQVIPMCKQVWQFLGFVQNQNCDYLNYTSALLVVLKNKNKSDSKPDAMAY